MTPNHDALVGRVRAALDTPVRDEIRAFAARLAQIYDGCAVLFYGSNLRSGSLDGVLDFYVLTKGPRERGLWPRVAYHEYRHDGTSDAGAAVTDMRAKVAVMNLATFAHAATGRHVDTTIWARFVQPVALGWADDDASRIAVQRAIGDAIATAATIAAALGPEEGTERDYWQALFRATYRAELRVEKAGREEQILQFGTDHFAGLMVAGWNAAGIGHARQGACLRPEMPDAMRQETRARWKRRRHMGKPLNIVRLLRAATTFDGGARYLAWKVHRHSGITVPLTPFRVKHPLLTAPVLLAHYWRERRRLRRSADQPSSSTRS